MLPSLKFANPDELAAELRQQWAPPLDMTVTEWADENRYLSPESSSRRGKYRSSFAPYQQGPMDAFSDPAIRFVTIVCSIQVGKTTITENCLGRAIDLAPGPMLAICPTHSKAEEFSKERLDPLFRDTPVLREKIAARKSRDSGNTIFKKMFSGGLLALGSAGVANDMASRPILYLFGEEVDHWEALRTGEGNALMICTGRLTTFWNHKRLISSSPTNLSTSIIWPEFLKSDQRYLFLPCPHCGHYHRLEWDNLHWQEEKGGKPIYRTVKFHCPSCGSGYGDSEKPAMLQAHEWRAQNAQAENRHHAGFHLWAAYSPWMSLEKIVADWWEAKDSPRNLQVHMNTVRGLPWAGLGATVEWQDVFDSREDFDAEVPDGVVALFCGVDTQNDRFECVVYGAGEDNEGWFVDYKVIVGDPMEPETREKLDTFIYDSEWRDAAGRAFKIMFTAVDTQGGRAQAMYRYCEARKRRRLIGIKGDGGEDKPLIKRPARKRVGDKNYKVWMVGTDQAKTEIYYRLSKDEQFGKLHVPRRAPFDEQWCRGLTAEECVTVESGGRRKAVWKLRLGFKRNEPLDTTVYALAAKEASGINMSSLKRKMEQEADDSGGERKSKARSPRRGGWVKNWRS